MSAISRIRDEGGWPDGSVLLGAEMEAFDAARPKWINGTDGGTWAPTAQVILGGTGLRVTGDSRFDAITAAVLAASGTLTVANTSDLVVASGGDLIVQAGGDLDIGTGAGVATFTVKSGSVANIAVGAALDARGATTFYGASTTTFNTDSLLIQAASAVWSMGGFNTYSAGSAVAFNGTVTFGNSTNPNLAPNRAFEIHTLDAVPLTWDTPGPPASNPDVWLIESDVNAPAPMVQTRAAPTTGHRHLLRFHGLIAGSSLTAVVVTTRGSSGSSGLTRSTYRLIRYKGSAAAEDISFLTTDAHASDASDWSTDILDTQLTMMSSPHQVDSTYTYAVLVNHPYQGAGAAMKIYDCKAVGTFDKLRVH